MPQNRRFSLPFYRSYLHHRSPQRIAQKGASQKGRELRDGRRLVCDLAFGCALLGIALMVLANEFAFMARLQQVETAARTAILVSTAILLALGARFHQLDIKCHMHQNNVHSWQTSLPFRNRLKLVLELFVCALVPLPLVHSPVDPFLCSLMFLRLYWLPRCLHLHSRLSTDAAAKSIAGLNRVKTGTRFMLKRMLFLYPGLFLSAFVVTFWLTGAYVLRLCESNIGQNKVQSYYNAIWMMCVTFLTIGYGDIYPVTTCGRLMAITTGVIGVCVASMIVAVIVQKISLSQAEERVHNFMARTKHALSLKLTAAEVLKESWLIYKNKQLTDNSQVDQDKVRHHQRRLSAAICTLRKLRKEQRIYQDDESASLDDVAKMTQNATEMVGGIKCAQEGLNERIGALEHRLDQIQQGIGALAQLLIAQQQQRHPPNNSNNNNNSTNSTTAKGNNNHAAGE